MFSLDIGTIESFYSIKAIMKIIEKRGRVIYPTFVIEIGANVNR